MVGTLLSSHVDFFSFKNLHRSLKKLFMQLMPWHTVAMQDNKDHIRVEDLQLLLDEMSEEIENEEKVTLLKSSVSIPRFSLNHFSFHVLA